MLAYYTSLVKKEDLVRRLSNDGKELSSMSNDLVCLVKEFVNSCDTRDLENAQKLILEAEELSKVVSTMTSNLKSNYESYLFSLLPQRTVEEEKETEEKQENVSSQTPDTKQLTTLLEAMKSLKEMKDSLGENKKV
jgi:hypothetical protein